MLALMSGEEDWGGKKRGGFCEKGLGLLCFRYGAELNVAMLRAVFMNTNFMLEFCILRCVFAKLSPFPPRTLKSS